MGFSANLGYFPCLSSKMGLGIDIITQQRCQLYLACGVIKFNDRPVESPTVTCNPIGSLTDRLGMSEENKLKIPEKGIVRV